MGDSLPALCGLPAAVVADVLDQLGLCDQALDPAIVPLFAEARLAGRARTVRVSSGDAGGPAPYDQQMRVVESLERGDVLVVAVDAGLRVATWGELFSCAAMGQGVAGVLTDGLVRDTSQIVELAFPVFAIGSTPLDTLGRADMVAFDEPVSCGGVAVRRGDFVVADRDGAVVVPAEAAAGVVAGAREKVGKEQEARDDLLAGVSLRDVWSRYGVF